MDYEVEIARLKEQIEHLKILIDILQLRDTGITAIIQKIKTGAVDPDLVVKAILEVHGDQSPFRTREQRAGDIAGLLRDTGLKVH